jgi:Flp pilus assembly protein TadB
MPQLSITTSYAKIEVSSMDRNISAGILGFLLALIINLFSPTYLYFVPSFLAAIIAIYAFRIGTLRDGLVVAFMTYIFNDGIYNTLGLATYYFTNTPIEAFNVDVWTMISPIVSAISAVIAAYIGILFAQARKPAQELPPIVQSQAPPA